MGVNACRFNIWWKDWSHLQQQINDCGFARHSTITYWCTHGIMLMCLRTLDYMVYLILSLFLLHVLTYPSRITSHPLSFSLTMLVYKVSCCPRHLLAPGGGTGCVRTQTCKHTRRETHSTRLTWKGSTH